MPEDGHSSMPQWEYRVIHINVENKERPQPPDAQLRMHEDTLKVLAVGRQSMAMQLNERLKEITPLAD